MKVFWSWQSDTSADAGRHFVRAALEAATARLADHPDLEDAERAEVDSDTSNVSGHPHIGETVLRKIRECAVFVADLTPVGKTQGGKKLPNPNVMIELGYAFAQVGLEQVVLVMNQAEGARLSALPFDLRFWRAPISYSLKRDATEEERAEVLEGLVEDLAAALGPCLATATRNQPPPLIPEGVPTDPEDPAVWLGARPAVRVRSTHQGDADLQVTAGPKVFVRIIPASPFDASRADFVRHHGLGYPLGVLGDYRNLWIGTSEAGAAAWNVDGGVLKALTQWFQATGEIWALWPDALVDYQGHPTFTDAYAARGMEKFFREHFATLTRFAAPKPWRVIIGARGLKGSVLAGRRYSRGGWSALADEVRLEKTVREAEEGEAATLSFAFLEKIYDAYGAPNLDRARYDQLLREEA